MHTHVCRYAHHARQHTHSLHKRSGTYVPSTLRPRTNSDAWVHTAHTCTPTHTHTHTCCCRPSFHTQAHTLKPPVLRTALSGDRNVYAPRHTAICLLLYEWADAQMKKQTAQTSREDVYTHTRRRTHGQVETAGDFISSCVFCLSPQGALPGRQLAEKAASGPCGHREPRCHY